MWGTAMLKRPAAAVGGCKRPAAAKKGRPAGAQSRPAGAALRKRRAVDRDVRHNSVPGADQPTWARQFVAVVLRHILNL